MAVTLNVHLSYEYNRQVIDYLTANLEPGIRLTTGETMSRSGDINILVAGRPDRDLLEVNKDLQALIIPWTGIPPQTRDLLADFPHIAIYNLHHNATPVAEMAMTLLLAAAKRVIPFDAALRRGDWTLRYQDPAPSLTLKNKTVLVLGYGEIGRRTAQICHALGMKVWAIKRRPDPGYVDPYVQGIYSPDNLHEVLPSAQVLLITLPLTKMTEGMIGQQELDLMPASSILVNIGRATIINEKALYEALKSGRIGAAGLDVWYNYPPDEESRLFTYPSEYPFWELENVVLSPHRAGLTDDINYLRMDHLAVLLNAAARNEKIPNKVDLSLGY
jgi:phosphoglycerate dehydrogenase-like enzyme